MNETEEGGGTTVRPGIYCRETLWPSTQITTNKTRGTTIITRVRELQRTNALNRQYHVGDVR